MISATRTAQARDVHLRTRFAPRGVRLLAILAIALCAVGGGSLRAERLTQDSPEVKAAVEKGAKYLASKMPLVTTRGELAFATYTLIRAEVDVKDPAVQLGLRRLLDYCKDGKYTPPYNNYEAAVELMALTVAEAAAGESNKKYKTEIEAIISFIVSKQHQHGEWDYFQYDNDYFGDTSQTQFALLGLWTAQVHGYSVPKDVWERAASWQIGTQHPSGGFSYHPRGGEGAGVPVQHGMTVAGMCSLAICFRQLYPSASFRGSKLPEGDVADAKPRESKKYGVLETVEIEQPEPEPGQPAAAPDAGDDSQPSAAVSQEAIQKGINRGLAWLVPRWTVHKVPKFPLYYLYGIERVGALLKLNTFGGHDWFDEGAAHLIATQEDDGGWRSEGGAMPCTCFAILFLIRATGKVVGDAPNYLGDGLQQGNKGFLTDLPDNPNQINVTDTGRVNVPKFTGDLDKLLNELSNPKSDNILAVQDQIVRTFQTGNREALIGKQEELKAMLQSENAEVRRTALWALARCEQIRLAPLMIDALDDENFDVVVEAHTALCVLSRKPLGLDIPSDPFAEIPPGANAAQRDEFLNKWRKEARQRWHAWYRAVSPYEDRDRLEDVGSVGSAGK